MDKGGERNISRRTALKLIGAGGASTLLPNAPLAAGVSSAESAPRFKQFLQEIEAAGAGVLQESRALMGPSEEKTLKVIFDHKLDVPWQVLRGTRLDPMPLEEKTAMLAVIRSEFGIQVSRMKTLEDMRIIAEANQGRAIYAQGIPVASSLVIMNQHVAKGLMNAGGDVITTREHPIYDLAFALVPGADFSEREWLRFPVPLANEDVHAGFVVFTGINPNWTSHDTGASVTGRKTFGGLAIRVPPSMMQRLSEKGDLPRSEVKRLWNSFLVEIPNSESLGPHGERIPLKRAALRGSSSSPVFVLRGGEYHFCGVLDSLLQVPLPNGRVHTFAVFHGPEAINETAKDLGQY